MRKLLALILVTGVTAGCLAACGGDDDDGTGPVTMTDGGMVILPDGRVMTPPGDDGSMQPGDDGGGNDGGGCDYTNFVTDLVNNKTASNTAPVATIPDPSCANSGSATQFSGLFH